MANLLFMQNYMQDELLEYAQLAALLRSTANAVDELNIDPLQVESLYESRV